jgi:hypothetical protein
VLAIDFHVKATGVKAGSIRADTAIEVRATAQGRRVAGHATITRLKLTERDGHNLGLDQDALDNLGSAGQGLLETVSEE